MDVHDILAWKKIKLEKTSKREMKNFQSISTIIFYITTHNFIVRNAFNLALHEQKEINPLKLWKNNILLYSVVKKESCIFIKWCTYFLTTLLVLFMDLCKNIFFHHVENPFYKNNNTYKHVRWYSTFILIRLYAFYSKMSPHFSCRLF